jgi:benzylsuccinate CoA-transferase BbsF subunit
MAPHGVFRCAGEQRWVAIAVRDEEDWRRFASAIGCPELANDARYYTLADRKAHEDELEELVTQWTVQRSAEEATEVLQAAGIAAFPSYNSKDLAEDAHLNGSGLFVQLDHPEVGKRLHIGMPWRMSATPCAVRRPAPCLGEHTDYVMSDVLGYSKEALAQLRADGVLA